MASDGTTRLSKLRCLNCFKRIEIPARATEAACPGCGVGWRISWVEPGMPKIRGPVWDQSPGART